MWTDGMNLVNALNGTIGPGGGVNIDIAQSFRPLPKARGELHHYMILV